MKARAEVDAFLVGGFFVEVPIVLAALVAAPSEMLFGAIIASLLGLAISAVRLLGTRA